MAEPPAESSTNPANPITDTHRERKPAGVEIYAPSLASEIAQVHEKKGCLSFNSVHDVADYTM